MAQSMATQEIKRLSGCGHSWVSGCGHSWLSGCGHSWVSGCGHSWLSGCGHSWVSGCGHSWVSGCGHSWVSGCGHSPWRCRTDRLWILHTFHSVELRPRSSRLCSCRPRNEGLIPWILLSLSLKTQPNWNWFQTELPSDKGRELYHFLLHCFNVQIGCKTMAIQTNISFLKHWIYTFHGWWSWA